MRDILPVEVHDVLDVAASARVGRRMASPGMSSKGERFAGGGAAMDSTCTSVNRHSCCSSNSYTPWV